MVEASEAKSQEAPKGTPDGSGAKSDSFEEKLENEISVFGANLFWVFWEGMAEV